jgi:Protein of unknown function (DUF3995)
MSTIIAVLIFLPLLTVGLAHLLWALGTTWPISSEALLAQTVVGRPGITRMPNRLVTAAIAVAIFAASIIAIGLADKTEGGLLRTLLGAFLALVFLGRGIVGYTAAWRVRYPTEPFATLDRKNYSPLCLWIGAGYLILVIMRLT